jgi:hypothetical protein
LIIYDYFFSFCAFALKFSHFSVYLSSSLIFIYILGGGRKIRDPEMERQLYDWYLDYHVRNRFPVTSQMIKAKALEFSKLEDFYASKGWLEKIKKKYNLQISRPSSKIK